MYFICRYTQQMRPMVLKTGCRHEKEIGAQGEYIMKQFAPACISAGEED